MIVQRGTLLKTAIGLGLMAISAAASAATVSVSFKGNQVQASSDSSRTNRMVIRVAGPNGYTDRKSSSGQYVTWYLPISAANGTYRYDVYATESVDQGQQDSTNGSSAASARASGRFQVSGGNISQPSGGEAALDHPWNSAKGAVAAVLNFLIPTASAADLTASSGIPTLSYEDTNLGAGTIGWSTKGIENSNDCAVAGSFGAHYDLTDEIQGNDVFRICGPGEQSATTVPNSRSLVVDESGDLTLADGDFFIDRSANRVGLNTTTPGATFHVAAAVPKLRLESTGASQAWDLNPGSQGFWFLDHTNSDTAAVKFQNGSQSDTLVTTSTGVGIGTDSPSEPLHVVRNDGTARALVEEQQTNTAQTLLRLKNQGYPRMTFTDGAAGVQWDFRLSGRSGSSFEITRLGTGGAEFYVTKDGNATLRGTLTEGSSREIKHGIKTVDTVDVLDKLAQLDIARWSYDGETTRHLGPMAEDFHGIFGLGKDAKHIAPKDLAGVAMASVQELRKQTDQLHSQLNSKDEQIAKLDKENAELRQRMKELEQMVGRLATEVQAGDDQVASAE